MLHGNCEDCPLLGHVVNGYGPKNAKLAVVGEAPGGYEARIGRPFVGPSGQLVRALLKGYGVNDEREVYWTNAVQCRGSETANPKIGTIRACNNRLKLELAEVQPQKILCLGGPALTAVMSSQKMLQITKYRGLGMLVDIGGRPTYMVPSYHPAAILRQQDLYRDLAADIDKVMTYDAPIPDLEIDTVIPWTVQDAVRELEDLLHASLVSCDIETTGLDPLDDVMTCIGFAAYGPDGEYQALVINAALLEHDRVRSLIRQNLEVNRPLVFHNGKYDLKFLDQYCGCDLNTPMLGDTMLLHYAADERTGGGGNSEERSGIRTRIHSLKTIARVRYDIVYSYNFNWDEYFTVEDSIADQMVLDLFIYNARDCAYTLRLWRDLVEEAEADQLRLHSNTLIPGSIALRKVEERGIYVDQENLRTVKAKFELEQERILNEIFDLALELTDEETVKAIAGKDPDGKIKPSSPKQMQELIAAIGIDTKFLEEKVHSIRTKWSGTDKNSLHKMALQYPEHHPVRVLLQDIMAYRVIKASVATFLTGLDTRVASDGRVHGSFMLHGTVTGRLSCVAGDTLVDMPRDMTEHPDGIPITDVKKGDWVYAFDYRRELVLKRVKWSGQTGIKQTVKVIAINSDGHHLEIRLTPEHLVRLRSGVWCEAANLLDGRLGKRDSQMHGGNPRLLTMVRRGLNEGYIQFWPHSAARGDGTTGGGKNKEHRWIYEQIQQTPYPYRVSTKTDIHHRDGNRVNNTPENLQELTISKHREMKGSHPSAASYPLPDTCMGPTDYRVVAVVPGEIEPVYDIEVEDAHNFIGNGICVHNSSNPNMQNFPNYGSGGSGGSGFASAVQNIDVVALSQSIRNSLCATPGYTLCEFDFSQLELRILAYYCDDEPLKAIFVNGEDIHTRVASEIFGKAPEEISGEERRHGKVVDFGIVYGRSAGQIVGGPEMDIVVERGGERWTIQQADGFLRRFFDGFPKVEPWLRASRMKAHTDHAVYSPTGRTRRLPLVLQDGHAERQAINSPIQALSSDICLHALTRLVKELPDGAHVISTIHDSILFEIRDDLLDEVLPFIRETMEHTDVIETEIPLVVDLKSGKKWGEIKKAAKD